MAVPEKMNAWVSRAYSDGDPMPAIEALKLEQVAVPEPKKGQVLIKVHCAAVNPIDWKLFTGGLHGICPTNFPYTPGFDVSGTVVKANECSRIAVGDEICADIGLCESCKAEPEFGPGGAFAEYACFPEDLAVKKGSLSWEEAAGLPLAALTSYQALFTGHGKDFTGAPLGNLKEGDKLLVLGGASATGAYAIQLAAEKKIKVTTTASENKTPDGKSKIEYCTSLGAEVINYKAEDWSEKLAGQEFDFIYDCVGQAEDLTKSAKVLKKGGKFFSIANFAPEAPEGVVFQNFLLASNHPDLQELVALAEAKKLKIPVDSVSPMDQVPAVLKKSATWASAGKVVIKVA